MPRGNGFDRGGECMEIEEDLVASLLGVQVVVGEVEVVKCDGTLCALIH